MLGHVTALARQGAKLKKSRQARPAPPENSKVLVANIAPATADDIDRAEIERLRQGLSERIARLMLSLDPQCHEGDCSRLTCKRSQMCEKWRQNILHYGKRGRIVPNARIIERIMLNMMGRYRGSQKTQIR